MVRRNIHERRIAHDRHAYYKQQAAASRAKFEGKPNG